MLRRSRARLLATDAERMAPLQVKPVSMVNLSSFLCDMAEDKQAFMNSLWDLLAAVPVLLPLSRESNLLSSADNAALVAACTIERYTATNPIAGRAFSVVDEKSWRLRRRFFVWRMAVGDWLEALGY